MKCIICDKETGSDKKRTCSGSCRAKASRMRNKTDIKTQAHAPVSKALGFIQEAPGHCGSGLGLVESKA